MTGPSPLRAYGAVTAAYWAFMLTDGALRMLVLLHFNALGFSPIQLAWLFLLYELAGIGTNLAAGWLAARFGLAATLYGGLALQIGALVALAQLDPGWGVAASVVFVMAVQGVSGVAKDLAKMSSKSAVKLLAPEADGALFKIRNDPRVTPVGRVLRRFSIDELPQLLNVIRGDMSLVGPRPDVPAQRSLYTDADWAQRCSVRPGITGLAQALYRSESSEAQRLAADLNYTRVHSIWLDLKICWWTVKRLTGRGAN